MARIRTIKPEFWTDEKIVSLPFQARLLFIGLWNFADDTGAVDYSPDRIRMQIFPSDNDVDVSGMIDLLSAVGLIDFWVDDFGGKVLSVRNWSIHQKIDNPSRKSAVKEGYRKIAIPGDARVAIGKKYGCSPGGCVSAECFYCGSPGMIYWHMGYRGRPTKWVYLSDLEFDHFVSEHSGGENTGNNMVLACRSCNRSKREFPALAFFVQKNNMTFFDSNIESSLSCAHSLDQGMEKEKEVVVSKNENDAPPSSENKEISDAVKLYNDMASAMGLAEACKITDQRRAAIRRRLKDGGGLAGWKLALVKLSKTPFCCGENDRGWRADLDFLCQQKSFVKLMEGGFDSHPPQKPKPVNGGVPI